MRSSLSASAPAAASRRTVARAAVCASLPAAGTSTPSLRRLALAPPRARRTHLRVGPLAASAEAGGNGTKPKQDKRMNPFKNTNRFYVPESCQFQFEMEWKQREKDMTKYTGFQGLTMTRDNSNYTVSSSWVTTYDWEDWSCSPHHRRSHLPIGVMQYPPEKGEGFPETFVPLIGLTDKPMLAQY